jgi:site-specific DNA-cytosine methylase
MFSGLGGWAEGLIAEGWRVIGVDIEDMFTACGAEKPEHYELMLRDVLTVHGAEFKDAELIVSSSPCTEYSYMAMPWSLAKAKAAENWARYQVAVGEASDQINPVEEPKPECRELFG